MGHNGRMRRLRRSARRTSAVVATTLLLGACGADSGSERAINPAPTAAPTTVATTVAPTPPTSVTPETAVTTVLLPTTTSPATTPPTTATGPTALLLRPGGLGDYPFGAAADPTIAQLTAILGPPTTDSGWVASFDSPFGVCPGDEVRGVTWNGLLVLFADATLIVSGQRHMFHYVYGPEATPAGLAGETGIGLGSTVAALRAGYPDVSVFDDELLGTAAFSVGGAAGLGGTLTDTSDAGIVTTITGGEGCGE